MKLTDEQQEVNRRAYWHLVDSLVGNMEWCEITGMSFNKSLAEARKIYAREVREKALKG